MFVLKYLSALVYLSVVNGDLNCQPCQCTTNYCSLVELDCTLKTTEEPLTEIPGNFSETIDAIDISGQILETLKEKVFDNANLTELVSIKISGCRISEIHKNAFNNLGKLQDLDASENNISFIDNDTMNSLKTVNKLDLSQNSFKNIPHLVNLTLLEELSLNNNNIQYLEENFLLNNSKLESLQISRNNIETISKNTFANLHRLMHLHISHNKLTRLPEDLLNNNFLLLSLILDNNSIVRVPETLLQNLNQLYTLDLQHNKISKLPDNLLKNNSNIGLVYFNNNEIIDLPKDMFKNLYNLRMLELSHNKIKILNSGLIARTTHTNNCFFIIDINLNNNNINSLPSRVFTNSCSLLTIDLSFNNISRIDSNAFFNADILHLNLSNNRITYLSKDTFKINLSYLDLSYNQLTYLPAGIFQHSAIFNYIRLTHNHLRTISSQWFANNSVYHLSVTNNNVTYFDLINSNVDELNLLRNQLNCDCTLQKQHELYKSSLIECFSPAKLKGYNWDNLTTEQFACPPKFLDRTSVTTAGFTQKIGCKVYGSPAPHIQWIKNNVSLQDNTTNIIKSNLSLPDDIYWYNLTFLQNTTESFDGQYFCVLSNQAGFVKMSFTVVQRPETGRVHVGTAIWITVLALVLVGLHVVLVLFYLKRLRRNADNTSTNTNVPYDNINAEDSQGLML